MILKISTGFEKQWCLIDKIREFTLYENFVTLTENDLDSAEYRFIRDDIPGVDKVDHHKVGQFRREDDNLVHMVIFSGLGFLCNDDGKTIERL